MDRDVSEFKVLAKRPKSVGTKLFPAKDTLRIYNYGVKSGSAKRNGPGISINRLAWDALGNPTDVSLLVNPKKNQIKVLPDGPFHIAPNKRVIYSVDLGVMPVGEYLPIGDGVYQLRDV
jgi:hypothetical protein